MLLPPACLPLLPPACLPLPRSLAPLGIHQRTSPRPPLPTHPQDGAWDASTDLSAQPWYFGASLDLGALGQGVSMQCCSSGDDEDDDIPLLTLDLGGEARGAAGEAARGTARLQAAAQRGRTAPQLHHSRTAPPLPHAATAPPPRAAAIDVSI